MQLGEGVEWALHCCTVLALVPPHQVMPAAKLAEFHQVPAAYLAKHLQQLSLGRNKLSGTLPLGSHREAMNPDADLSPATVHESCCPLPDGPTRPADPNGSWSPVYAQ